MSDSNVQAAWRILGQTVRGAAHLRNDKPNQDAIDWSPKGAAGLPAMLAIADGHGSETYFRSDVGSEIAVRIAMEEMEAFVRKLPPEPPRNYAIIKHVFVTLLPKIILERWRKEVSKHWSDNRATDEEWKLIQDNPKIRKAIDQNVYAPYGATLLAVLVTRYFIGYLQLGDGDIVMVSEKEQHSIQVMTGDERLLANETASLCTVNESTIQDEIRSRFQILQDLPPALIMLSTDGYANSYTTPEGFFKVGPDILKMLKDDGIEAVEKRLEEWLKLTSERGSGDDISLGILCHTNALPRLHFKAPAVIAHKTPASRNLLAEPPEAPSTPSQPPLASRQHDPLPGGKAVLREDEAADITVYAQPGKDKELSGVPQEPAQAQEPVQAIENASGPESTQTASSEAVAPERPPETVSAESPSQPAEVSQEDLSNQTLIMSPEKMAELVKSHAQQSAAPSETRGPGEAPAEEQVVNPSEERLVRRVLIVSQVPRPGSKFRTIADALGEATPGTRVEVYPGIYEGQLLIDKDIELIAIKEETSSHEVQLKGPAPCLTIKADNARIEGFRIRGSLKKGLETRSQPAIDIGQGRSRLLNCAVSSESPICIRISGRDAQPTIMGCYLEQGQGKGILYENWAGGTLASSHILGQKVCGIEINNGSHPEIEHCNIMGNAARGALVAGGTGTFADCKFIANTECGIEAHYGSVVLKDCILQENRYGLILKKQSSGRVQNCDFRENKECGVMVEQSGISLQACQIRENAAHGMFLRDTGLPVNLLDCAITRNRGHGLMFELIIAEVKIIKCFINENNKSGLALTNVTRCGLEASQIKGNGVHGLYLTTVSNSVLRNCEVFGNHEDEISLQRTSSVSLRETIIEHNAEDTAHYALSLTQSTAQVEGCQIKGSKADGIKLAKQSQITLLHCQIQCQRYCLMVSQSKVFSKNNTFSSSSHEDRPWLIDKQSQVSHEITH